MSVNVTDLVTKERRMTLPVTDRDIQLGENQDIIKVASGFGMSRRDL